MSDATIEVLKKGPLMVTGEFTLLDSDENPIPLDKKKIFLCRCGASTNKPFCDGAHSKIGFDAAAEDVPESAE